MNVPHEQTSAAQSVPELSLATILGRQPGEFTDTTRYATVVLKPGIHVEYVPSDMDIDERPAYTSPGYGKSVRSDVDFEWWQQQNMPVASGQNRENGYIAGFPLITGPNGEPVEALHLYLNNTDIFDASIAIPTLSIESLFVYTKAYTSLKIELENMADNGQMVSQRFQVPLLRDTRTEETVWAAASEEEIEDALARIEPMSVLAYSTTNQSAGFRDATPEEIQHLLDK